MRRDEARLLDMQLALRDARDFIAGVSREMFLNDKKLQNAVCMKLEVVGEAARAISSAFKDCHTDIPWSAVVGLRHRIVHEYFRLDLEVIWEIVDREVAELLRLIDPLVQPP